MALDESGVIRTERLERTPGTSRHVIPDSSERQVTPSSVTSDRSERVPSRPFAAELGAAPRHRGRRCAGIEWVGAGGEGERRLRGAERLDHAAQAECGDDRDLGSVHRRSRHSAAATAARRLKAGVSAVARSPYPRYGIPIVTTLATSSATSSPAHAGLSAQRDLPSKWATMTHVPWPTASRDVVDHESIEAARAGPMAGSVTHRALALE